MPIARESYVSLYYFMFAMFLNGWELVLILAVLLALAGVRHLPQILKGLGDGLSNFHDE